MSSAVAYTTQDRQWDGRLNVQTDEDLTGLLNALKHEWDNGKFRYILCSGTEIGTRPYQDDYQIRHVHVALLYVNRVSKKSILKNFGIKEGNGYYLVPRNRDLPYQGWRDHHIKEFSKTDKNKTIIFEAGELPKDASNAIKQTRSNEDVKKEESK